MAVQKARARVWRWIGRGGAAEKAAQAAKVGISGGAEVRKAEERVGGGQSQEFGVEQRRWHA